LSEKLALKCTKKECKQDFTMPFKESMSVPKAVYKTILGPGDIQAIFEPELN
jgi:hypothetical protein